jgi:predicted DNA-binding protein (MmcQ/YjbR family)
MDPILTKLRQICLALPDTKETFTWGNPHFRVGEKIFCGYTDHDDSKGDTDGPVIGCKLEKQHARDILADPRFRPAPYVGRHGWVSMDASGITDWAEVRALVHESYRLIAPKPAKAVRHKAIGKKRRRSVRV